jgi:fatty acid-binding protein DegV
MLVVVDGAVDVPSDAEHARAVEIVDSGVWLDDHRFEGGREEFWTRLRAGEHFATEPPSPDALGAAYSHAEQVIAIHVSAELSATIDHARTAVAGTRSDVTIVDSRSLSVGAGLLALTVQRAIVERYDPDDPATPAPAGHSGLPIIVTEASPAEALTSTSPVVGHVAVAPASVLDLARALPEHLHTFACIQDTATLRRSGRAGLLPSGHLARNKPLLLALRGRAIALDQVKDRAHAWRRMAQHMRDCAPGGVNAWAIGHGDAADAAEISRALAERLGLDATFEVALGPTVGAHLGPDAVVVGVLS